MAADTDKQSFWEHLDVLRAAIVNSLLVDAVYDDLGSSGNINGDAVDLRNDDLV